MPRSDYSVQLAEDRAGDADAASALDIKYNVSGMKLVTGRLLKSAKDADDPRLNVCREFYGTLDGKRVTGWDTHFGRAETSDNSHLWHVHISFLRKYATDQEAMAKVLSVIIGEPSGGDMSLTARDFWRYDPGESGLNGIANGSWRADAKTNKTVTPGFWASDLWAIAYRTEGNTKILMADVKATRTELDAAKAREEQILTEIREVRTNLNGLSTVLATQLAPQLVTALRSSLAEGLDDEQLTAAVELAVREVFGALNDPPK